MSLSPVLQDFMSSGGMMGLGLAFFRLPSPVLSFLFLLIYPHPSYPHFLSCSPCVEKAQCYKYTPPERQWNNLLTGMKGRVQDMGEEESARKEEMMKEGKGKRQTKNKGGKEDESICVRKRGK